MKTIALKCATYILVHHSGAPSIVKPEHAKQSNADHDTCTKASMRVVRICRCMCT